MAVLETIRVKFGILITVIIAVALLSFIIDPSVFQSATNSSKVENTVGVINGENITVEEFYGEVEDITTVTEIMTNSSASSEEQQNAIRENAWGNIIYKNLVIPNAQNAGINVGQAELDLVMSGNIPSGIILNNPLFYDQNGVFSTDNMVQFINLAQTNPYYAVLLNNIYDQIRAERYQAKYSSLLSNSNYVNSLMLEDNLAGNNNTFDVEFIMLPYGYEKDSTIVVSNGEIENYYNSHKKFYKQLAARDIQYVSFVTEPSTADIAAVNDEINEVYDEFKSTDDMSSFLTRNSSSKYDEHWYTSSEFNTLPSEIKDFVTSHNNGTSKIVKDGDAFYAARVLKRAMIPDSIKVKFMNADAPDSLFADAPEQWIPQTPGFEKLMTLSKGEEIKLNGMRFKILDRSSSVSKKQIAVLKKDIVPSQETIDEYYAQATAFYSKVKGSYDNFKKVVEEDGLYAQPVYRMREDADRLGSIDNSKAVTRWAFDSVNGQVSDIITLNGTDFVVAAVTKVYEEGYTPLSEVSSMISNTLYQEKAAEKKLAEVKEQINGAESLNTVSAMFDVEVSKNEDLSFGSNGVDPKFVGAASVAEEGVINAVAGNYGVYVYKVTAKNQGTSFTEDDVMVMNERKNQAQLQQLIYEMMNAADVKDYRARFF